MEYIHPIFKWLHIIAGIIWIGLLYFFNWINGHVAATLDADSKKKVVPELMPRALYFFRWGAAWTWVTGVVLLYVIFWNGSLSMGMTGEEGSMMADGEGAINSWTHLMIAFTFLAVFIYDFIYSKFSKINVRVLTIVSVLLIISVECLMIHFGNFGYRAFNIHIGAMFGTMMAFNVWFRIWPAQQSIINSIKNGDAPDGNLLGLAGLRSKHNTYMSFPLIWTMINQHTVVFSDKFFGITGLTLVLVIILSWHIVWQLYKKSGEVKGF
tara:strand:- start:12 stop:812 length:801 start_codon:yes stop_codon:yes gene_type:complete